MAAIRAQLTHPVIDADGHAAVFSSDIGHWDVPDMTTVLEEAYGLVEHGVLDEAEFRAFTFANAARLHAGMNPAFFTGTVVEADVARLLHA